MKSAMKMPEMRKKDIDSIALRGSLCCIALSLLVHLYAGEAMAEKRIGVLIFNEEARFTESQQGILDQLKKDGFGETAVKFTMENARGSKAKLAEVARKFAAAKMDLIITIGTPATVMVSGEVKDVPIVFSMLYDPVEIGVAQDWKSSGNNTTGVSPRVPVAKIMDAMREVVPIRRLAVLYTPGEKHTEIQLKELQKIQVHYKIRVIPVILDNSEEIAETVSIVAPTVDAMYLTGSSIINASIPKIVEIATRAKVVTVTHIEEFVSKGVLLGICVNPYRVGRLAGEKAVKILRGARPSDIPIETLKTFDLIVNKRTAKAGQFDLPPAFLKTVTKTIE
jgi:putative ABC transport system substrate-binding protein